MSDLDEALTLRPTTHGLWAAAADPRDEAHNGMFGGWTSAILLRAAMDHRDREGSPAAISVSFIEKIEPGTEITVQAQRLGASRSLQHWQSTLLGPDQRVRAQAMVVFATRRESDGFTEPPAPKAPDPESLDKFQPPGAQGKHVLHRPVFGYPPVGPKSSSSLTWVRELSGRAVDYLQLTFLSDCCTPRIWFASSAPRPSASMILSVHFLATEPELLLVGDNYVLSEVIGTRGADSTVGQQLRLWSAQGALLATSEQLCWYR